MRKLLKEPFLHFVLLGGVLFAVFYWVRGDSSPNEDYADEIVVTAGRVESLTQQFSKVRQRPPTEQELESLIQEHIREEILYREARAMGLDRDDTIVRRRMRQKMEFLSEDIASLKKPTEEELEAFLTAHPEQFREESRFTFRQVYLNVSKREENAEADARVLLARLREQDGDASEAGDTLMIHHRFENVREGEVSRALGTEFLEGLRDTPLGSWQGPIASGYGLHLVHIAERIEGKAPDLAEVRAAVLREWTAEKRQQTNEAFYQSLRERYKVTIAQPTDAGSPEAGTTSAAR